MKNKTLIFVLIVVAIVMKATLFTVDQTKQAIVLEFGKPRNIITEPGLKAKVPFIQNVIQFEKRLLVYDASPAEVITKDKKTLVIDNFSRWRISDPLLFYQSVRNENGAQARLDDIIYAELRVELGRHDLSEIVSKVRSQIMKTVTIRSDSIAQKYGLAIVDVRIKRADLPPENEKAVYNRMRAERERQAARYRSEGEEDALKIKTNADKEKVIILANAYAVAESLRGEGDAKAASIYAKAYEKDRSLFELWRTLEAYKKMMADGGQTLILSPDAEVFKYLKSSD